jgi:hypothetical protein
VVLLFSAYRDLNKLEVRRELRRKPKRAGERRTICWGHIGRQLWTNELFAIWRKASERVPYGPHLKDLTCVRSFKLGSLNKGLESRRRCALVRRRGRVGALSERSSRF